MAQEQKQTETAVVKYEATRPVGSSNTLSALLSRPDVLTSMSRVVPKHLKPERLAKMALMAASRQPKLLECTQESILKSVMTAAQLGIDCSGVLGRGYLVPYKNKYNNSLEAQFIIGYLGLVDLARRGGDVQSVTAHVVYKQDDFKLEQGLTEVLEHKPDLAADKKDSDITGAYMVARFKSGGHHIEYMSRREIDGIRARSKAGDSGPWRTDYSEMCRKTVVRRGCKYLPLSPEVMGMIVTADDEFDEGATAPTVGLLEPTQGRESWAPKQEIPSDTFGFDLPVDKQTTDEATKDSIIVDGDKTTTETPNPVEVKLRLSEEQEMSLLAGPEVFIESTVKPFIQAAWPILVENKDKLKQVWNVLQGRYKVKTLTKLTPDQLRDLFLYVQTQEFEAELQQENVIPIKR